MYKAKDLEECEIEQLVAEIPKLFEEELRSLEGKITIEEAGTALKNIKHAHTHTHTHTHTDTHTHTHTHTQNMYG